MRKLERWCGIAFTWLGIGLCFLAVLELYIILPLWLKGIAVGGLSIAWGLWLQTEAELATKTTQLPKAKAN